MQPIPASLGNGAPFSNLAFLPLERIREAVFHELSHFYFSAHDEQFHACMRQMCDGVTLSLFPSPIKTTKIPTA